MFHSEIVMTLHSQRTCSCKVLKRNAFLIYELDISWDPGISPAFSKEDSPRSTAHVFLHLPSPTSDLSQKHVPSPLSWFSLDAHPLSRHPPPWLD